MSIPLRASCKRRLAFLRKKEENMRILFVTPYPPSRIRVRSYGFFTQLQAEHEVTLVTQCSSAQEFADAEALRKQGYKVIVVSASKQQAMLRSGLGLFSSDPLQVAYARSHQLTRVVSDLLASRSFEVVHVEHLRGIASLEPLVAQNCPLIWDAVDCISLLFKQAMVSGHSLSVRALARLEHRRTRYYEAELLNKLRRVVVTSERDRRAMIELRGSHVRVPHKKPGESGADITVLPNGVDLEYFAPANLKRQRFNLVFSGKMSYHANVATAVYLYQQIMPLIWQKRPEATLTIVGSNPPKAIQDMAADPRVEVTGYVDDIRPYIARAEAMISPMVYSVGIQNKVLEAMALGTPVVVASAAAAALAMRPEHALLEAESPADFADAALQVMEDDELRSELSQKGREYVEQQHNWRVITDRLVSIYRQAVEVPAVSTAYA
jgi:sugar transferase (PEP-CTERM/EpsH1 system associated)